DITCSTAGYALLPYQWECKAHARFAGYAFLDQAVQHGHRTPVVVVRANRRRPIVIVDAEHFLNLVSQVQKGL
ncbi:MAG: hypothetical protein MN733_04430, partial [Nitrososphaera sp.]|nr:hypothetical protein [Nitrososphaera sp.]